VSRGEAPTAEVVRLEPLIDLGGLVAGVRWRRRMWAIGALAGLLLGAVAAILFPGGTTASTRVYVVQIGEADSGEAAMKTSIAVLRSTAVASAALQRLGSDQNPTDFLEDYTAESIAANTIDITAEGRDTADAIARAQALADAFIADHVARAENAARAVVDAIKERQDALRASLAAIPASDLSTTAVEARAILTAKIDSLETQLEQAAIGNPAVAAGTQIIDAPHKSGRGFLSTAVIYTGLGGSLGTVLGVVLAAVATVARDRPILRKDIAAHLGASVVAQLPRRPLLRPSTATQGERERTVASLVRLVRSAPGSVSLLHVGCSGVVEDIAAELARGVAADGPVTLIDDLPGRPVQAPEGAEVELVAGTGFCADDRPADRRLIGVGSVEPGTAWLDLPRLGRETLLLVRTGSVDTAWLHTIARQLADVGVTVIGVVVVHPDPRDRSDGTLWDALNVALRGRAGAHPADRAPATDGAAATVTVPLVVTGSATTNGATNGTGNGHRSTGNGLVLHPGERDEAASAEALVLTPPGPNRERRRQRRRRTGAPRPTTPQEEP
jgi:Capsular polysaccharide biosynthesis protein